MLEYTLAQHACAYNEAEEATFRQHPPVCKEDWSKDCFAGIKHRLKQHLGLHQFDRCAYCRLQLNSDGYWHPLDHVIPKSEHPEWLFEPRNLVLTCTPCNGSKSARPVLHAPLETGADFPEASNDYSIFHPHFDAWQDHLEYQNELFITAVPGSKGAETIRTCKLYRCQVVEKRAKELKLGQQDPLSRSIHWLTELSTEHPEFDMIRTELLQALSVFSKRVEDAEGFKP